VSDRETKYKKEKYRGGERKRIRRRVMDRTEHHVGEKNKDM
jgi:hypothetical protein